MSIQLIQQAICYMEEHIYEDIGYAEVARCVHMSSYNFHRTFSFIAGMTPNEYLRKRRLTLAAQELQTTDMDYRMEHRDSQKFIALVKAFPNEISTDDNDHSIPDFWAECDEKKLIEPMRQLRSDGKKDLYGLCSPAKKDEKHFNYGIGVAVDENTDMTGVERLLSSAESMVANGAPAGYSMWETTPADYAVFKCMGPDGDCIGDTWDKVFKEFIPQTGYMQTDDTDYEIYFEKGEVGLVCELWVPVEKA